MLMIMKILFSENCMYIYIFRNFRKNVDIAFKIQSICSSILMTLLIG